MSHSGDVKPQLLDWLPLIVNVLPWKTGSGVRVSSNPFPQPSSLSAALLERQLELLGSLLAVVEEPNQVQILDVMLAASNGPPSKPGLKESPLWRRAILITICSTALAGLDSLARRFRGELSHQFV